MKLLVTPDFSKKIATLPSDELFAISEIAKHVKNTDRESLSSSTPSIDVRPLGSDILTIKHGRYRVYASFGSDNEGEYLLFLDFTLETSQATQGVGFFATKDPRTNPTLDPNRNMTIDPRRNMTIDPQRNMTIDPNRNMTIDPRRNMTIDPRRNMTIDPNRNMAIDPRRNMTIDPNRNMTIDPRRNRYYGGPYVYNVRLEQEGFVVRANDKVSLIFDTSARFISFYVSTGSGGANIFNVSGGWIGFLVPTQKDLLLRFDPNGQWIGIIV